MCIRDSYSTNYQISGRELMTPDEVRMLDNRYALLFLRGERPVMAFKYDIMKHPNVKLTRCVYETDKGPSRGAARPPEHGNYPWIPSPHGSRRPGF